MIIRLLLVVFVDRWYSHMDVVVCVNKTLYKYIYICNPIYFFINNSIFVIGLSFKICRFLA
jgi:hypothetical protein